MPTNDFFRVHETAMVKAGKYAGLGGTVTDERTEGDTQKMVRVSIEGVQNGQPVSAHVWLKRSQLERFNHGGA
jgi:hypothetical protein